MIKVADNKVSLSMEEIIKEAEAVFSTQVSGWHFPLYETDVYFDLDYLWSNPKTLKKITDLIIQVIRSEKIEFDVLGGISSRTGSFGTTPIASVVANELSTSLVVFDEEEVTSFDVHPHSLMNQVPIKGKKILLIKDVVVGGSSLNRVFNSIKKHGGKVAGVIVLVDFSIIENRYKKIPETAVIITLSSERVFSSNQV